MTTPTTVNVRLQLRADTAANWTAANPTLLANEVGLETDTKKLKVGNGSSAWNSLAYFPSIVSGGTVLGNLEIGTTGTLTFEGSTADGFETTLAVTNPTADRTITLPNQSGTVVVSGNASIVDADIAANAEIAVSKLADGSARQLLQTDAAGTGVEWTSNVDIPGTLDVTGAATFDGAVTVAGDLTVNGTTTNINTQNLVVEDKNIILGDVATPTDVTADGGGITLKGATDKTINWVDATDAWTSSERFSVPLGSAASPSLTFTGDENTGIYSPGADQVAISTNGTGRLFVNSDGTVSVGNALTFSGATSLGLRASTNTAVGNLLVLQKSNDGTNPANIAFCKSRGTASSPTAVLSEDVSAAFFGLAFDGTTYQSIGGIKYVVQGIAGTNDVSGYITLDTRPSGVGAFTQERLRITSDGKVGVGTSAPDNPLHVVGAASTTFTNNPIVLKLTSSNTFAAGVGGGISFTGKYNSGGAFADLAFISGIKENATDGDYAGALVLGTRPNGSGGGSMERLRITSGGNVGIGTTSPATPLEVSGTSAQIRVIDSAVDMRVLPLAGGQAGIFGTASNHSLVLWTNSTERARITSSGQLLVGTSSARGDHVFQIEGSNYELSSPRFTRFGDNAVSPGVVLAKTRGTTAGSNTIVNAEDRLGRLEFQGTDGTATRTAALIDVFVDGTPGTNDMPGRLVFSTTADGASSPTERMRITNGGSIYFGVTSDPSGTVGGSAFLVAGSDRKILRLATTTTAAVGLAEFYNANGSVGAIATSGTSTSFNTSSDYRLKENVTAVTDGITRLQQLKPSRFNFIADPAKTVDGFLAHEVQSVVPEAITGEKDAVDDDGNPIYQGIDQSKLVPLLTAALQEALAEIESLKARVTALEP